MIFIAFVDRLNGLKLILELIFSSVYGEDVPKNILENLTVFRRKQPKGFIDVWWLYDDGGNFCVYLFLCLLSI